MLESVIRLLSKGQIVIPKQIRSKLSSNLLIIGYDDKKQRITIEEPRSSNHLGGSLNKYAKKYIPIEEIRAKLKGSVQ